MELLKILKMRFLLKCIRARLDLDFVILENTKKFHFEHPLLNLCLYQK